MSLLSTRYIRVGDARQTRLNIDAVVSFLLIISTNARLEWPKILGLAGNGPFTRTYLIAGYSRGEAFSRRETRSNGGHRSGEEEESRTSNVFSSSSLDYSFSFQERNCRFSNARNKILLIFYSPIPSLSLPARR